MIDSASFIHPNLIALIVHLHTTIKPRTITFSVSGYYSRCVKCALFFGIWKTHHSHFIHLYVNKCSSRLIKKSSGMCDAGAQVFVHFFSYNGRLFTELHSLLRFSLDLERTIIFSFDFIFHKTFYGHIQTFLTIYMLVILLFFFWLYHCLHYLYHIYIYEEILYIICHHAAKGKSELRWN